MDFTRRICPSEGAGRIFRSPFLHSSERLRKEVSLKGPRTPMGRSPERQQEGGVESARSSQEHLSDARKRGWKRGLWKVAGGELQSLPKAMQSAAAGSYFVSSNRSGKRSSNGSWNRSVWRTLGRVAGSWNRRRLEERRKVAGRAPEAASSSLEDPSPHS